MTPARTIAACAFHAYTGMYNYIIEAINTMHQVILLIEAHHE